MTVKEFIDQMQSYYGLHYSRDGDGPIVAKYLSDFSDRYRAVLADVVVRKHSKKWRCVPDVAILEECSQEVRASLHESRQAAPALPDPNEEKIISAEQFAELREKLTGLAGAKSWRKQAGSTS